jgi:putative transposase
MGRHPRAPIPGCLYHVIARGNNRQTLFGGPDDCRKFLDLLEEALVRHAFELHAFCLMTTHLHLLVQMREAPVSRLAHLVCFRYSRWINRREGRTGHLFERRHRSIMVKSDRQLLMLLRYIHRNPVEAGLVTDPGLHPWSSHRAYLGAAAPVRLTTRHCLALLGADEDERSSNYQTLVTAPDNDGVDHLLPPEDCVAGLDRVEGAVRTRKVPDRRPASEVVVDLLAAVGATCAVDVEALRGASRSAPVRAARGLAALIARDHPRTNLEMLARILRRHPSTLSEAAARWEMAIRRDADKKRLTEAARAALAG